MIKKLFLGLTDNVEANKILLPMILILLYSLSLSFEKVNSLLITFKYGKSGAFLLFTLIYLYSNSFFQPDLDLTPNRPGKTTFPLGSLQKRFATLTAITYPINRLWFFLWEPYSHSLTHRGISHWPVLGTLTRLYYIAIFGQVGFVLSGSQMNLFELLTGALKENFNNINFIIFLLPIFISDFFHFAVDFWDSVKRGKRFCSTPYQEFGVFLNFLKQIKKTKKKRRKARKNK